MHAGSVANTPETVKPNEEVTYSHGLRELMSGVFSGVDGWFDSVQRCVLCCLFMRAHTHLLNLCYPPVCLLCRERLPSSGSPPTATTEQEPVLCEACRTSMPRSEPPVCQRCGVSLPGAFDAITECAACRSTPLAFEIARAPWQYTGPVREAVRQFKYHRRWRLGRWLAQEMTHTARTSLPLDEIAMVLPVPLHWMKRRAKGFNPSEALASALAHALDKPYLPRALRRTRWTRTQTRLGSHERFRNVFNAFVAQQPDVHERSVLLVDDVLTSGATANACALALKAAGARAVFVLTAARTVLE